MVVSLLSADVVTAAEPSRGNDVGSSDEESGELQGSSGGDNEDEWEEFVDASGRPYYHHFESGITKWERPNAATGRCIAVFAHAHTCLLLVSTHAYPPPRPGPVRRRAKPQEA